MKAAKELKEKGNECLKQKHDFYEAIRFYENAMSLFQWIVNKKVNWKKQEIEDEMIEFFEYETSVEEERNEIIELQCSCLLNIAFVSQKLFEWNDWSVVHFLSLSLLSFLLLLSLSSDGYGLVSKHVQLS